MNATRFNQDGVLYDAVLQYLKHTAAELTSANCVSIAIDAALATVYSAVADFGEEWNSTAQSIMTVPSLPTELVLECFKQLSFNERVTAAKVCRSWRVAIVGTPTFWSSITVPYRSHDSRGAFAVARFRNISARSGSVPLDVRWDMVAENDLDDALRVEARTLFRESMWHIRSLVLGNTPNIAFLTSLQAPALESLRLYDLPLLCIPARWIQTCAPRLRTLHISSFTLPDDSEFFPLRSIEDFGGYFRRDHVTAVSGLQNIFALLPCIVSLNLKNIHSADELPRLAPPSLMNLEIFAGDTFDLSPILDNWTPAPPAGSKRTFHFHTKAPPALNAALRHVVTTCPSESAPASVSLRIHWSSSIKFSASSSEYGIDITISATKHITTTHELRGNPCLSHIGAVSLAGPSLVAFLRAELDLPALRMLSITDRPTDTYRDSAIGITLRRDLPPLRAAPTLREITFNLSPDLLYGRRRHDESDGGPNGGTVALLPDFLATRVHWPWESEPNCPREGLVSILIIRATPPSWEAVCGLRAFTSKIYYASSVDNPRLEMSPPPPAPAPKDQEWDEAGLETLAPLHM